VANTLNLFRNGAVGFIDWLGPRLLEPYFSFVSGADVKGLMQHTINDDDLVSGFALGVCGGEIESMWIAEPPPTLPPLVGAVPGIGAVRAEVVGASLLRLPLANEQLRRDDYWRRRGSRSQ